MRGFHIKYFRLLLLTASLAVLACPIESMGQSNFEGSITYRVEYESSDSSLSLLGSSLPAVTVYTVKGKQSIFEQSLAGGGTQAIITNIETGDHTLIMVFMGKEYRVDLSQQELATVKSNHKLKLVETGKKKNILGYDCDFVWGISPSDSVKVYYAPELTTEVNLPPFEGLKGLPLEYEVSVEGLRIRYIATNINADDVDDSMFVADPNLRKIGFAEFAKSFAITN